MSPWANALSDADLFWSKVDRSGECWMWQGSVDGNGYGRISVGAEMWRAHRLAWFMVMGKMPENGLYHIAPQGGAFSRVNPGAIDFRRCVRPQHFRDGPGENAKFRWARKARSGWPPEFRGVVDKLMSTEQAQVDLIPLLLYQGNLTVGRAQAMFNFTLAAQAAEAERLGDVTYLSRSWPDMTHTVGLHKPMGGPPHVGQFWARLVANPSVMSGHDGLRDYVESTLAASRDQYEPVLARPIGRYSPWSTRAWRKVPNLSRAASVAPLPEVWPFLPEANPEHDLVMAVDRAVPKGLPEMIRQDVCQDLILAVLDGTISADDLAASQGEYVRHVFRQYPTKYGPLSLDKAIGDKDGFALLDTMADAPLILGGQESSLSELRDRLREEEARASVAT